MNSEFAWTDFYESIANELRKYRNDRIELVKGIHEIASRTEKFTPLTDQFKDGHEGPVEDIDPFTVIGTFNRGINSDNRAKIAIELANFLGVATDKENLLRIFEEIDGNEKGGVPIMNNQNSWFYSYHKDRKPDDIDTMWNIFDTAIDFADTNDVSRSSFAEAFDDAMSRRQIGMAYLTMGLYWIRPQTYQSLDSVSRKYIKNTLGIPIGFNGPKGNCSGEDYLILLGQLREKLDDFSIKSFPELTRTSWQASESPVINGGKNETGNAKKDQRPQTYSVEDIISEGCFVEKKVLNSFIERLEKKKNLILQGAPGTGKTWLAKRLAYALVGQKKNVRHIQFHPNLSYEDFVRGYRPSTNGKGKLELVDGLFLQMAKTAKENSSANHVLIIEEINRGNPAQIFGEILTLIEEDKRKPEEALELSYARKNGEEFYIPENLYVIGTMNIADRSLALIDLALRRRFAFVNLKPEFGEAWLKWGENINGLGREFLKDVQRRVTELNETIEKENSLGPQFKIGHSYFTPSKNKKIEDPQEWFRQIVETEIKPYLEECWFDAPDEAKGAIHKLLNKL